MTHHIVPSGSFAISTRKPALPSGQEEAMEAYLGTCVGVTLKDDQAKLGGLIHILLPEPTGTDIPFEPAIYATTGLPLFIDKLCSAGASKDNLTACIAGGALVGKISEQDLWLDIGGRTTEAVENILREQGVWVDQIETGGLSAYRMALDLQTLETKIEPLLTPPEQIVETRFQLGKKDLADAIHNVKPIPQIALKIIRMLENENYDMDHVAQEIRKDQVISAKVLNFANSAIIGAGTSIDSIDRALIVLGERRLFQLIVSVTVEIFFSQNRARGYSLCKGGLFYHALATAMTAHEISVFSGRGQPDIAYTAGLLHDIGKIALDQYVMKDGPFFYRSLHKEGLELCKVERERFGLSHTEMGAMLAQKWDLPENLVDAIRYHHKPDFAAIDRQLVTIVYLADLLMASFKVGQQLTLPDSTYLQEALKELGLHPEQLTVVIDRIPRTVFDISMVHL